MAMQSTQVRIRKRHNTNNLFPVAGRQGWFPEWPYSGASSSEKCGKHSPPSAPYWPLSPGFHWQDRFVRAWLGSHSYAFRLTVSPPYPITNVQCSTYVHIAKKKKSRSESESLGILSVSGTSESLASSENQRAKVKAIGLNVSERYIKSERLLTRNEMERARVYQISFKSSSTFASKWRSPSLGLVTMISGIARITSSSSTTTSSVGSTSPNLIVQLYHEASS